jgi:hypothetical protein
VTAAERPNLQAILELLVVELFAQRRARAARVRECLSVRLWAGIELVLAVDRPVVCRVALHLDTHVALDSQAADPTCLPFILAQLEQRRVEHLLATTPSAMGDDRRMVRAWLRNIEGDKEQRGIVGLQGAESFQSGFRGV